MNTRDCSTFTENYDDESLASVAAVSCSMLGHHAVKSSPIAPALASVVNSSCWDRHDLHTLKLQSARDLEPARTKNKSTTGAREEEGKHLKIVGDCCYAMFHALGKHE